MNSEDQNQEKKEKQNIDKNDWKSSVVADLKENKVRKKTSSVEEKKEKQQIKQKKTDEIEINLTEEETEELECIEKTLEILKVNKSIEKKEIEIDEISQKINSIIPKVINRFAKTIKYDILDSKDKKEIRNRVTNEIRGIFKEYLLKERLILQEDEREKWTKKIVDEIIGFGPLEELIEDDEVTEIMVNGPYNIYVEKAGRLEKTNIFYYDNMHLMRTIEKIMALTGRKLDLSTPHVDTRLEDGSRVHIIIPPLAIDGPTVTIRKFAVKNLLIEDLINLEALTPDMAFFIGACVKARLNIIVSGGTGSGKTTFLNVLASLIPLNERIITVEDSAELKLKDHHEHVVRLETRTANIEGKGEITIRELIRDCLRMRPDRIIVGECRGAEALDMLTAMNTGHDGSFTTLHANSPLDAIARLETMVMMSEMDLPSKAIRNSIASAVDLIIQLKRYADGKRKVSSITEIVNDPATLDGFKCQELFYYKQTGIDKQGNVIGEFVCNKVKPLCVKKFQEADMEFPEEIFT